MISIITPIYNTADYLDQCIQSVLQQTYQDFELILIDDGSTDDSYNICKKYEKLDVRIRVYKQENNGVSAARNLGLQFVEGEWITLLDSDDQLLPAFLEEMINDMVTNPSASLIYQNTIHVKNGKQLPLYKIKSGLISVHEFYKNYNVSTFGYAHSKLYKTSIIKKNQLKFNPKIKFAEDCLFMVNYLLHCDYVFLSNKFNYIYFGREGSLVTKKYPFHNERQLLLSMKMALISLMDKHHLSNNMLIEELEYPLERVLFSNVKIPEKSIRYYNYSQLIQQNKQGIKRLINSVYWKNKSDSVLVEKDMPDILKLLEEANRKIKQN